ncbi:MAG TPA: ABC transporter substrate-binding protein [Clostridiales bacterium]|nr:ABC transporter substrate-binding protein [Clostridiales bacterium]
MKRVFLLLTAILVIMSVFVGCSLTAGNSNTIKLGVNYELSGAVATYGRSSVEGIELAIEEINSAGGIDGKEIELIKYDNKSDVAEATTLTTKLMTQDKVLAVMGPATSGAFMGTLPVAEQNKIPAVSGSATADEVTADENGVKEYAFRICFSDSYQGTGMANYALNNLNKSKAVIVMDSSSDYGKGLAENFIKTFEAGGGVIVAQEAYMAGDTDFNSIITKVKGEDFDVIFKPGYYEEAGLIIKQAREQGIDVPILGADGFDSPELVNLAGKEALNNVYFSNHYSSLDQDPVVQNFIKAFEKKYDKQPDAFHALGYDLARFVVEGIKHAEKLDGQSVKAALEATTNFNGVTGNFSVDENHNAIKALVVIELKDGAQYSSERLSMD